MRFHEVFHQAECPEPLQEDKEEFQGGAVKETINGDHDKEASHEVSREDDSTPSPAPGKPHGISFKYLHVCTGI